MIAVGLLVRLVLSAVARHPWDFWVIYRVISRAWDLGGVQHVYEAGVQFIPGAGQTWPYGPLAALSVAWPPRLVAPATFNVNTPAHLFLGHLPHLLADLAALAACLCGCTRRAREDYVRHFWLSPFWIYFNYCYAQVDIIGAALGIAAVFVFGRSLARIQPTWHWGSRLAWLASGALAGAAVHVKSGHAVAALALVITALSARQAWRRLMVALGYAAIGWELAVAGGVAAGLRWFPGYWEAVTGGPIGYLLCDTVLGLPLLWQVPAAAALLVAVTWHWTRRGVRLSDRVLRAGLSDLLLGLCFFFYLSLEFHPHWMVWTMPVWVAGWASSTLSRAVYRAFRVFGVLVVVSYDSCSFLRTLELPLGRLLPGDTFGWLTRVWEQNVVQVFTISKTFGALCLGAVALVALAMFIAYPTRNGAQRARAGR
jgi:hypothetical protein